MSPHYSIPIAPSSEILTWLDESWELDEQNNIVWARDGGCRNIRKGDKVYQGRETNGYIICRTSTHPRKKIRAHHLVWYFIYGEWPSKAIDHIDGDRSNNQPSNLRLATRAQNAVNRGANKGKSLPKGVFARKGRPGYVALVADRYGGLHETPEDAHKAALQLGKQLYGGFYK